MSSDDEGDVCMGDDDGESEALSGSEGPDAEDEEYEDSVFVDDEEEEEEAAAEDEEEEEDEGASVPAEEPPNARIADIMHQVDRARAGDASFFVSSSSDIFQHFPTLRVMLGASRLGEAHETDPGATHKSHISGRRADRRVYPYNKRGRLNPIYFHHTEAETVQRFMVLTGFNNPKWLGYSKIDTRSLADFYHKSMLDINKLEYGTS